MLIRPAGIEHDGSWSVVGEVEWPRTPRDASMLAGVLAASGTGRRNVAICYEPVPPRQAERQLQADKTKRDVTVRLRAKTGQVARSVWACRVGGVGA